MNYILFNYSKIKNKFVQILVLELINYNYRKKLHSLQFCEFQFQRVDIHVILGIGDKK